MPFAECQFPGGDFYLIHDNAQIHMASVVRDYLDSALPVRVLPHPPYSPDLNPVEHVGNLIKQRYFELQNVPNSTFDNFTSIDQIWDCIKRIGYQISEDSALLTRLASSIHSRFSAVISASGYYTKY